jgi:hypothetical protein
MANLVIHTTSDAGFSGNFRDFDLHAIGNGLRSGVGVNDGAKR